MCPGMLLLMPRRGAGKAHPEDALTLALAIHNTSKFQMLPGEPEFCPAFKPAYPQRKKNKINILRQPLKGGLVGWRISPGRLQLSLAAKRWLKCQPSIYPTLREVAKG